MLLQSQYNAYRIITIASSGAIIGLIMFFFSLQNVWIRLFIVVLNLFLSGLNVYLLDLCIRIEPMISFYTEAKDQDFLLALLEKVKVTPQSDSEGVEEKVKEYPQISYYDVPLQHIQFVGNDSKQNRKVFFDRVLNKFPEAKLLDLADSSNKLKLSAEINSRSASGWSKDRPVIVFTDDPNVRQIGLNDLGIYSFICSNDLDLPVSAKVLDNFTMRQIDSECPENSDVYLNYKQQNKKLV